MYDYVIGQYTLLTIRRDRATYDSSSTEAFMYAVPSAGAAPDSPTYGLDGPFFFFFLAASYAGEVIIGLNRCLDDISNTISAGRASRPESYGHGLSSFLTQP